MLRTFNDLLRLVSEIPESVHAEVFVESVKNPRNGFYEVVFKMRRPFDNLNLFTIDDSDDEDAEETIKSQKLLFKGQSLIPSFTVKFSVEKLEENFSVSLFNLDDGFREEQLESVFLQYNAELYTSLKNQVIGYAETIIKELLRIEEEEAARIEEEKAARLDRKRSRTLEGGKTRSLKRSPRKHL